VPASEISPYREAPRGESFWLALVGALAISTSLWLAWWAIAN
jgi:hypothetical protein